MASFPCWLRAILLGFTLASFVPQYKRIRDRTDSDGISLSYVLLNLIVATQQFSLYLLFVIDDSTVADFLVKSPPSIENYLDLAQFGIVWLCQLVLFILCLVYRPLNHSPKWAVIVCYTLFLFITLIPVLWMWTMPPSANKDFYRNRNGLVIFYGWFHIHCNYVVTIVAFAAFVPQVLEMRNRFDPGALSFSGLRGQALVFIIIAISWTLRLQLGAGVLHTITSWYRWVGWATLDNVAYAITQMVVWWTARRFEKPPRQTEATPLLS